MIFDLIKHAKQLLFDDSKAKIGTNNVQGAIESVKSDVDSVKTDVDSVKTDLNAVEYKMVYSHNGGSYVYVKSNGEIGTKNVPLTDEGNPIYPKEVLEAHDGVLKALLEWKSVGGIGYLTADWQTLNCGNISAAKEVLLLGRWYSNVVQTMTINGSLFRALSSDANRVVMPTNWGDIEVKCVNYTQIQARFINATTNPNMQVNILVR